MIIFYDDLHMSTFFRDWKKGKASFQIKDYDNLIIYRETTEKVPEVVTKRSGTENSK